MLNTDWLNDLILLFVKWWVLAAATLFLVARSRNTSAATLHALMMLVMLTLAFTPIMQIFLPGINLKILPANFSGAPTPAIVHAGIFIYGCVVLVLSSRWVWHLFAINRLYRRAKRLPPTEHRSILDDLLRRLQCRRTVELRYSRAVATPITFGFYKPTILLPEESLAWDANRVRRFLSHELAHIRRLDWVSKISIRFITNIFWVVPAAWTLLKKIEWFAELACDDAVINSEGSREEYADDLLAMTGCANHFVGATALIESHAHYERIAAVLDGGRVRAPDTVKFWPYAFVFLAIAIMLCGVRLAPRDALPTYELLPLLVAEPAASQPTNATNEIPPKKMMRGEWLVYDEPVNLPKVEIDKTPLRIVESSFDNLITAAPAPENIGITTRQGAPKPIHSVLPKYPSRALRKHVQGKVTATFNILPDGTVSSIIITSAVPKKIFDQTVVAALTEFRYPPQNATLRGMRETFEFKLIEDASSIPAAQQ